MISRQRLSVDVARRFAQIYLIQRCIIRCTRYLNHHGALGLLGISTNILGDIQAQLDATPPHIDGASDQLHQH